MKHQTKIATCCYCGSRQALRLTARDGHELACGSCGAPLHEMRWLKAGRDESAVKRSPRRPAPHGQGSPETGADPRGGRDRPSRPKRRKRRKGFLREIVEEVFDVLEDIVD
ncbi:MAG: hypothetical protein ACOCTP_01660 [Roseicyclus sp.]